MILYWFSNMFKCCFKCKPIQISFRTHRNRLRIHVYMFLLHFSSYSFSRVSPNRFICRDSLGLVSKGPWPARHSVDAAAASFLLLFTFPLEIISFIFHFIFFFILHLIFHFHLSLHFSLSCFILF